MSQKAVEIILMRQLASYLATPILLFDPAGTLLFYNEPAEAILNLRFDETGELPLEQWSSLIHLTAEDGSPLPLEERPSVIALQQRQAAHRVFWMVGADGVRRKLEATGFPLDGQGGRHLGAVVILWEVPQA
jgi:PAS domain-containing protein